MQHMSGRIVTTIQLWPVFIYNISFAYNFWIILDLIKKHYQIEIDKS